MKNRIMCMLAIFLTVLGLVLASCSTPSSTPSTTSATTSQPATSPTSSATSTATAQPTSTVAANMVKLNLKKADGTTVEKSVEKPQYGGVFVQSMSQKPLGFDDLSTWVHQAPTLQLTNNELLGADWSKGPEGTGEAGYVHYIFPDYKVCLTGMLAETWDISQPGKIVFHIRQGVHWQNKPPTNGRELTSDDVLFTIQRMMNSTHARTLAGITSVAATDKYTVTIQCPPAVEGDIFEQVVEQLMIVPRDAVTAYGDLSNWKNSIGTGAFILSDYVDDSSATFIRNPNYWQKDPLFPQNQLPYLDGVKFLIIQDSSTRIAAMRTGKVDQLGDYYGPVAWQDGAALAKSNPEMGYLRYLGNKPQSIVFAVNNKPFNDIRVRQALSMAIDQQAIVSGLFKGNAELLLWPSTPVPEFKAVTWTVDMLPDSSKQLYEYHPDRAAKLLADAGYATGFQTEIICQQSDVDMLSIVKDYWAKIGVNLKLNVQDFATWTAIGYSGFPQMYMFPVSGTSCYWQGYVRTGDTGDYGKVSDPVIDKAYANITAAWPDQDARNKLLKDVNLYIIGQDYIFPLPGPYLYTFWQPWVKGYSGERSVGANQENAFYQYVWYDQGLRHKLTGN